MEEKETKEFFECLGEIWRDITAIEFLMRAMIARREKEIGKFPKPPYTKGREYLDYPKSFSLNSFGDVVKRFNKYSEFVIPQEIIDLRNAMAHGVIVRVDNNKTDLLFKFRVQENKKLKIELSMPLEKQRIDRIRQELKRLRLDIGKMASDNQSKIKN